jgi:mono/diheme cytochrome c family protein
LNRFARIPLIGLPVVLVFTVMALTPRAEEKEKQEFSYVGTKSCRKCHIKEWKSWQETKMAQTFEVLKPGANVEAKKKAGLDPEKDYTTDETCLACHTTGYGKEGGFVSMEKTPDLAGVGCEMCHGPGGTYTLDQYMSLKNKEYKRAEVVAVGMVETVGKDQCVVCHNSDSPFVAEDYEFDFEANKGKDLHEQFPLKYEH